MKAVLMSIKPKWCEKIFNGEKTVEVRKTAPKLKPPFKVYVYCTASDVHSCLLGGGGTLQFVYAINYKTAIPVGGEIVNGTVIGEFVCDRVIKYGYDVISCAKFEVNGAYVKEENRYNAGACLSAEEMYEYSNGKTLHGWHITEPKLYDKPKELEVFWSVRCTNKTGDCKNCEVKPACINNITRPPQSWCYVEEIE